MDWGLGELGRREGPEKALQKTQEIADLSRRDLYLYIGNLKARQHVFGIVGMFYPLRAEVRKYPAFATLFGRPPGAELRPQLGEESQLPLL